MFSRAFRFNSQICRQNVRRRFVRRFVGNKKNGNRNFTSNANPVKSGLKTSTKVLLSVPLLLGLAGSSIALAYLLYKPRFSIGLIGESEEFGQQLSKELEFPFDTLGVRMSGLIMRSALNNDITSDFNNLLEQYPECSILYAWKAAECAFKKQPEEAEKWLARAHQIIADYPEKNRFVGKYVPATVAGLRDAKYTPTPREIVPNKLWTLLAPHYPNDDVSGPAIDVQATILRVADGSLMIINPTSFDQPTVNWINSLGNVATIITPTNGHSDELAKSSLIWPNAKLYGSDAAKKHFKPHLPWNWLSEENQVFGPELQIVNLKGHLFNEFVFYHPETKSLLGLTDMVMASEYPSFFAQVYRLGNGVLRGPYAKPLACQNYSYFFTSDQKSLKKGLEKALSFDIQNVPLGHGVVVQGDKCNEELRAAFDWCLNPQKEWSAWESLYYKLVWLIKSDFYKALPGLIKKFSSK